MSNQHNDNQHYGNAPITTVKDPTATSEKTAIEKADTPIEVSKSRTSTKHYNMSYQQLENHRTSNETTANDPTCKNSTIATPQLPAVGVQCQEHQHNQTLGLQEAVGSGNTHAEFTSITKQQKQHHVSKNTGMQESWKEGSNDSTEATKEIPAPALEIQCHSRHYGTRNTASSLNSGRLQKGTVNNDTSVSSKQKTTADSVAQQRMQLYHARKVASTRNSESYRNNTQHKRTRKSLPHQQRHVRNVTATTTAFRSPSSGVSGHPKALNCGSPGATTGISPGGHYSRKKIIRPSFSAPPLPLAPKTQKKSARNDGNWRKHPNNHDHPRVSSSKNSMFLQSKESHPVGVDSVPGCSKSNKTYALSSHQNEGTTQETTPNGRHGVSLSDLIIDEDDVDISLSQFVSSTPRQESSLLKTSHDMNTENRQQRKDANQARKNKKSDRPSNKRCANEGMPTIANKFDIEDKRMSVASTKTCEDQQTEVGNLEEGDVDSRSVECPFIADSPQYSPVEAMEETETLFGDGSESGPPVLEKKLDTIQQRHSSLFDRSHYATTEGPNLREGRSKKLTTETDDRGEENISPQTGRIKTEEAPLNHASNICDLEGNNFEDECRLHSNERTQFYSSNNNETFGTKFSTRKDETQNRPSNNDSASQNQEADLIEMAEPTDGHSNPFEADGERSDSMFERAINLEAEQRNDGQNRVEPYDTSRHEPKLNTSSQRQINGEMSLTYDQAFEGQEDAKEKKRNSRLIEEVATPSGQEQEPSLGGSKTLGETSAKKTHFVQQMETQQRGRANCKKLGSGKWREGTKENDEAALPIGDDSSQSGVSRGDDLLRKYPWLFPNKSSENKGHPTQSQALRSLNTVRDKVIASMTNDCNFSKGHSDLVSRAGSSPTDLRDSCGNDEVGGSYLVDALSVDSREKLDHLTEGSWVSDTKTEVAEHKPIYRDVVAHHHEELKARGLVAEPKFSIDDDYKLVCGMLKHNTDFKRISEEFGISHVDRGSLKRRSNTADFQLLLNKVKFFEEFRNEIGDGKNEDKMDIINHISEFGTIQQQMPTADNKKFEEAGFGSSHERNCLQAGTENDPQMPKRDEQKSSKHSSEIVDSATLSGHNDDCVIEICETDEEKEECDDDDIDDDDGVVFLGVDKKDVTNHQNQTSMQIYSQPLEDLRRMPWGHWKWPNFYSRLGLPEGSAPPMIVKHFRKLSLLYHPDKCELPNASERFQHIKEAYEHLMWK